MNRSICIRPTAAVFLAALLVFATPAHADDGVSDPWITTKVKMSLLTSDQVDGLDVNVDTTNGRVTLHGTVDSSAEKQAAAMLARDVDGVREVRNLVQVVASGEQPQVAVDDQKLAEQVRARLEADEALSDSTIEVKSVNDGVVVLAGDAETLSDHRRALETANAVEGVSHVASEIQSPDTLADEEIWQEGQLDAQEASQDTAGAARDLWITTQAKVLLIGTDGVPALDVNVDTRNREVTLFGIVSSEEAKQAAAQRVESITGVEKVHNELQVVATSERERVETEDAQVAERVRANIAERPGLEDADIAVAVSDGVARLTGTVASQGDRLAALVAARSAEGVRSAVDDLRVQGQPDVAAGADEE